MRLVKQWIRGVLSLIKLPIGFSVYLATKKTPDYAYQSLINLFCLTKGYSSDYLSRAIGIIKRPYLFKEADGVLGKMSETHQRNTVVSNLREKGYHVFANRLPADVCDRLLRFASTHSCKMRPMDGDHFGKSVETVYHRGAPQVARYDFEPKDLLDNPDVQGLLADLSFASVAQEYLGARPVVDVLGMWWHTDFSDKPDMEAAQYYHFDMDRPKWLKFFIYLTDVGPENGPHTFVAGSHKSGNIPSILLRKGYARLSDQEIADAYDKKDIIEFSAPRGTIIAEDTRGLHKGKHVEKDDRLILQIQFSNTLFGTNYPKTSMGSELCTELKRSLQRYPKLYTAYL